MNKLKIILTGSTGMVGEGVLLELLRSDLVESVLIVNRRPAGYLHPKLKEVILKDFFNAESIASDLTGYDTCLFCLGVSSVGMKETEYTRMTYDLTLAFAGTLIKYNPGMRFSYISGSGTDSSEKGRIMWARVKGKTENDLRKLPFSKVYAYRPGILKASKGQKYVLKYYKYFSWLYPIIRFFSKRFACTLSELGQSMIRVNYCKYPKDTLEVKDIIETSVLKS